MNLASALLSPRSGNERGGSLMLDLTTAETASKTLTDLNKAGYSADTRGATLRLSPGIQTTEEATRALIEEFARSLNRA